MTKHAWLMALSFPAFLSAPLAQAQAPSPAMPQQPALFNRLGGIPAIAAVVDETLRRAGQDERIKARFLNANLGRLRSELIEQICAVTGGPCVYQGLDMKTAHRGMGITAGEFDALVGDLKAALDRFKVPAREQGELVALLAPTKTDIVEAQTTEAATAMQPEGHAAPAAAASGPVVERAQGLREAASLLDRADVERRKGNRSLAEQLFSFAELIVGVDTLSALASYFRDGAPPRINTPTTSVSVHAPPQPLAVGNSDEEEPPARPAKGSLSGAVQDRGAEFAGFAIVTLEPASGRFHRRQPRHRSVEQRDRQFAPRVLVVPVGSTVAFPNFDNIYHNVFSRSSVRPFDLGLYKAGQEREIRFDKEGIVRIGCNLHANMSAIIAVVSAPYYAVTDAHGRFAFRSLAPGNYRLRAYTENSDEPTLQTVHIAPERNTVTVALPAPGRSGLLADKFGLPRVEKSSR